MTANGMVRPPCLIGMEACVGAHHLSRKLQMLGHDARLMPAKCARSPRDKRMTSGTPRRPPKRCAPRAATRQPPRRPWLRTFVVRCGLPCDPPVGGHSCEDGFGSKSV